MTSLLDQYKAILGGCGRTRLQSGDMVTCNSDDLCILCKYEAKGVALVCKIIWEGMKVRATLGTLTEHEDTLFIEMGNVIKLHKQQRGLR